jgi:hypothetical protein
MKMVWMFPTVALSERGNESRRHTILQTCKEINEGDWSNQVVGKFIGRRKKKAVKVFKPSVNKVVPTPEQLTFCPKTTSLIQFWGTGY